MALRAKPQFVTITGIDDQTDLGRVEVLSARYPVEWAVLYASEVQGHFPRFASLETISRLHTLQATSRTGIDLAAHLCGDHAKAVMEGSFDRSALDLTPYGRVQVNHRRPTAAALQAFQVPGQTVIGQWRDAGSFPTEKTSNLWLFDRSGGRGIVQTAWPVNPHPVLAGYAGGISPDTVRTVVATVAPLSPAGFWIDMETGVRTDDWLDLDLVEQILHAVYD